jgi:circadian clock protein KaiC
MIRVSTGIEGLDEMVDGGIPAGHTILLMGPAGSGKTTFALQFIWNGLVKDEIGMFISLEEEEPKILKTASRYGWDFQRYVDKGTLSLLKLDALDISATMARLKSELPKIIDSTAVSRVVIDPFTLLEMLYETDHDRRVHTFELCDIISKTGATTLVSSELGKDGRSSWFGLMEYVVDGVILLRNTPITGSEDRMVFTILVTKMRWSNHAKEIKPYDITDKGIIIHSKSAVF